MVDEIRETIKNVSTYVQGKTIEDIKEEFNLDNVVKLCFNENPYAPYPSCLKAIKEQFETLNCYPEADYIELKELIGKKFNFSKKNVALSHGAVGILETVSKLFIEKGDEVIIPQSTFGLYEELSKTMGAVIKKSPLNSGRIDIKDILEKITSKTKLIWLCNPHNPTGTIIKDSEFEYFIDNLPEHVWVIADEAYHEFSDSEMYPDTIPAIKEGKNIISVRTFSKAYGMAGLRLGYVLAAQKVIELINRVSQPFNANKAALAGAKAVLKDSSYCQDVINKINNSKEYLMSKLRKMDCEVFPSHANFVFFRTPYPAEEIYKELLQNGVMVASGNRWNYKKGIRVSVGKPEENEKFLTELEKIIAKRENRT